MKKGIVIAVLLILAAAGAGGFWYYSHMNMEQQTEGAVFVTSVADMNAQNSGYVNRYAGVVEAQETVDVIIESGRKVKEVRVKAGEVVHKGQLLYEYDLTSIEQELQEAELELERLKNESKSLEQKIETLVKEQKKASKDNQLSYTIEIESTRMSLKKNSYDQTSKQSQIQRLKDATKNTEVRSSIDGIIQKVDATKMTSSSDESIHDTLDDFSFSMDGNSENNAFITILSTGEYRVKGSVNEMNTRYLSEGVRVIVRSRTDENELWYGTISTIDRENPNKSNNDMWGFSSSSGEETTSSTYPFYVDLESSDNLMLGQHVYIEPDMGQSLVKTGIWLNEGYLVDLETAKPFVWAASEKNRLVKKYVTLGQYDAALGEYEIISGLDKEDYIAWPTANLEEGMLTTTDYTAAMTDFDYENIVGDGMDTDYVDFGDPGMEDLGYMDTMIDMDNTDNTDMADSMNDGYMDEEALIEPESVSMGINQSEDLLIDDNMPVSEEEDLIPIAGPGMEDMG